MASEAAARRHATAMAPGALTRYFLGAGTLTAVAMFCDPSILYRTCTLIPTAGVPVFTVALFNMKVVSLALAPLPVITSELASMDLTTPLVACTWTFAVALVAAGFADTVDVVAGAGAVLAVGGVFAG